VHFDQLLNEWLFKFIHLFEIQNYFKFWLIVGPLFQINW
jgi:hypothetical protein